MNLSTDNLSEPAIINIKKWLTEPKYREYRAELVGMIEGGKWQELEDAFFQVIEFGTGGRRGTTGIGSNRINKVTIGESAQALCEYAKTFDAEAPNKGIVIAYDTRLSSPELSRFTATVCAASGFTTYIFDDFRSTPELSFAVRQLGAAAGIVISASHNPPADNGFKAYWSDGGQLVAPHDKGVLSIAEKINRINTIDYHQAVKEGLIREINSEVDGPYFDAVVNQAETNYRDVNIVYSPLHGAGQTNALPALRKAGFKRISLVEEQMVPDGNFPTIEGGKPNPEEKVANDRAVAMLMAEEADIAITNDPDADRIGVVVRHNDTPIYLSGNQSATLMTEFALRKLHEKSVLTNKHYIAKTIVTTDMITAIADKYNVKTYGDMLIGFKYIGELLLQKESSDEVFVIGGEESYGILKGDYARDKDGAVGALILAEYAAELKLDGKTLYDRMLELYVEHGLYTERLDTVYRLGASGFEQMQAMMAKLRSSPPRDVNGYKVSAILDYKTLTRRDTKTNKKTSIDCKSGNVVVLELGDRRRRITIRPSGTEPKLKFYTQWYEEVLDQDVEALYSEVELEIEALAKTLEGVLIDQL